VVRGDFNGDDLSDLAFGAPGENNFKGAVRAVTTSSWACTASSSPTWARFAGGEVEFIPGSASGLTATGSEDGSADSAGIGGTTCQACGFGAAVG
jgi:hypothetical protein